MLSLEVESSESGGGPWAKSMVVKCFNCHSCTPSGSADFFSEIANRRVRTGMTLEIKYEDQLHARARGCDGACDNAQAKHTSCQGGVGIRQCSDPSHKATAHSRK